MLLQNVQESYLTLVMALLAKGGDDLTTVFVQHALDKEHKREKP